MLKKFKTEWIASDGERESVWKKKKNRAMERLKFWGSSSSSSSSTSMITTDLEQEGHQSSPAAEKRRRYGGWKCMPYIIANETCERVATTGLTANFTVYLVKKYNMEMVTAANAVNIFSGTTNFAPILGAFISDCYWGRYRTLACSSVATFLGMLVLTMTAAIPLLRPPSCGETVSGLQASHCEGPSVLQMAVLLLSLALLTLGSAGIRPCGMPFGVDQFDRSTNHGRRELSSFLNWYYCSATAGIMVAMTVVVYIQDSISWSIGFGIPAALMLFAITIFIFGSNLYVHVPPKGTDPFSSAVQVFVAAFRKRRLNLPFPVDARLQESVLYNNSILADDIDGYLPLTLQFVCLNKAGILCDGELKEDGTAAFPWRLCAIQQIEEVKCLIRILPIWVANIFCFIAIVQQGSFTVLQAMLMDRSIGKSFEVPAGSLMVASIFVLTVFMPLYDRLLVPFARRFTGISTGITLLQRQGIGMAVSIASMIVAGIVEQRRRESSAASRMSAMWLLPQLGLMGIAEAMNAVGQVEFYNGEFPEHMRTQAMALFSCSMAGASYLSSGLVGVVREYTGWLPGDIDEGKVDYYYYFIANMGIVNLLFFVVYAHFYRYKGAVDGGAGKGKESSGFGCDGNSSQGFLEEERLPLLAQGNTK